jgi:RNA polymerase sigma-70 factor (ECF subfamily)
LNQAGGLQVFEDTLLKAGFNRGDGQTIRRIYQKYKDDLLRLAVALFNDEDMAADVLNDSFIALAESMGKVRIRGNLKSYLTTCLVNRARNVHRAAQRRKTAPLEQTANVKSDAMGPAQSAALKEEYQQLQDAMAKLPWPQRETIILHLQNDMRFREIAGLQNVSVNTAKSRYRCGLDKLRSLLNSEVKE